MWPILFLIAFILFLLIPKDSENEWDDEEDFIDEMILFLDDEEDDDW